MQRALIQFTVPKNYELVKKALITAHREDLIGNGKDCLIPANPPRNKDSKTKYQGKNKGGFNPNPSSNRNNDTSSKRKSNHSKSSRGKNKRR